MSSGGPGAGERPLYERDPAAWYEHLAEGNRTQPRKRVSAQFLLRDVQERLLLVDPVYKPDWDLPGGMVEANEPPDEAVRRELREELGLRVPVHRLLCVDWVEPHGPWDDLLVFVFEGGLIGEPSTGLRPVDGELARAEFCTPSEAEQRLRDYVWRRTRLALEAGRTGSVVYSRNGYRM